MIDRLLMQAVYFTIFGVKQMKRVVHGLFLLVTVYLAMGNALAQTQSPDELVKTTIDSIMNAIETDEKISKGDIAATLQFVEARVAPHFDFSRMTRLAVGRPWRQAKPEQREALIRESRTLLIRSYAAAFTRFKGIKIEVLPLKKSSKPEWATVESIIRLPTAVAQPISVNYEMEFIEGRWLVFDLQIDGASLIINNRSIFKREIDTSGIEGLIITLRQKNAEALIADQSPLR